MRRFIPLLLLALNCHHLSAQKISDNPAALELAKRSMNCMYNLDREESEKFAHKLEAIVPDHPAASFLKALNIYWQSMPLSHQSPDIHKFQTLLQETLRKSSKLLEKDSKNEEAIFFSLAAHGYLAQYYAEENSNFKALKEAKNAYSFMKSGFNLIDHNPEFYYTTGLYNYYREQYPESHPGYKPFMWFFASGDKVSGLKLLDKATQKALFTKAEAKNYAAHIYLRYEDSPIGAEKYSRDLVALFPGNHLYRAIFSETLLGLGKFDEAIVHINHLKAVENKYFKLMGDVYYGIWVEKHQSNHEYARKIYLAAIDSAVHVSNKSNHYVSMAYCGLGRISLKEGNREKAKEYFKKVLSMAYYPSVRKDAEMGLKKI